MWICQEVVLARTVVVMCGTYPDVVDIRSLILAEGQLNTWKKYPAALRLVQGLRGMESLSDLMDTIYVDDFYNSQCYSDGILKSVNHNPGKPYGLPDLLHKLRHQNATDPRDKVYAALGMMNVDAVAVHVDYEDTVVSIMKKVTSNWIVFHKSLRILERYIPSKMAGLPSWAMDWTVFDPRPLELQMRPLRKRREHLLEKCPDREATPTYNRLNPRKVKFVINSDDGTFFIYGYPAVDSVKHIIFLKSHETLGWNDYKKAKSTSKQIMWQDRVLPVTLLNYFQTREMKKGNSQQSRRFLQPPYDPSTPKLLKYVKPDSTEESLLEAYCRTLCGDIYERDKSQWPQRQWVARLPPGKLADFTDRHVNGMKAIQKETMQGRAVFVSEQHCWLGLAPDHVNVGDHICIVPGSDTPFLLRPGTSGFWEVSYTLVGECYVHGLMDGYEPRDDDGKVIPRAWFLII
jgi:hypothetical protein